MGGKKITVNAANLALDTQNLFSFAKAERRCIFQSRLGVGHSEILTRNLFT
jgi:hypothetical protein